VNERRGPPMELVEKCWLSLCFYTT